MSIWESLPGAYYQIVETWCLDGVEKAEPSSADLFDAQCAPSPWQLCEGSFQVEVNHLLKSMSNALRDKYAEDWYVPVDGQPQPPSSDMEPFFYIRWAWFAFPVFLRLQVSVSLHGSSLPRRMARHRFGRPRRWRRFTTVFTLTIIGRGGVGSCQ